MYHQRNAADKPGGDATFGAIDEALCKTVYILLLIAWEVDSSLVLKHLDAGKQLKMSGPSVCISTQKDDAMRTIFL